MITKRQRYVAPLRFHAGDEVSVVYLKVVAANRKVVLDDGSEWTQRGRKWGNADGYLSRFDPYLTDRKHGLDVEKAQKYQEDQDKLFGKWQLLAAKITRPHIGFDNVELIQTLKAMLMLVESVSAKKEEPNENS